MPKFVLTYSGGRFAETVEEHQDLVKDWKHWFETLGDAMVDASPFGASVTLDADGSLSEGGRSGLLGYSIVTADDLDDARSKAQGCPNLVVGGTVEIYQSKPME